MLKTIKKAVAAVVSTMPPLASERGFWQIALPLAIQGISSFMNNKAGNKNKNTQTSTQTSAQTSAPTVNPEYSPLQKMLIDRATASLGSPTSLPRGYEEGGIRTINKTYDLAGQSLGNSLTARGLGGSAIAGAGESRLASGRASDIVQFQSQLPLVQRQLQQEDLANAMSMLNFGMGRTNTGTNTGTGTSTSQSNSGSPWGAGLGSIGQVLGFMYGNGSFGGNTGVNGRPGDLGQGYFGPGY